MLRHALRRLLWLVPTIFAFTIVAFSLATGPGAAPAGGEDLPRFFQPRPPDVRSRVEAATASIHAGDDRADVAVRALAAIGGAALPLVLPSLDSLEPAPRTRVALALAPVAARMGVPAADQAADPARAVAFWNRFWADRSGDFRPAGARRAVRRFAARGTAARRGDLVALDTFCLAELFPEVAAAAATGDADAVRRLLDVAAHVTGRNDRVADDAGAEDARAAARRWASWWRGHRAEYTSYGGADRVAAMLVETKYGRWLERALSPRAAGEDAEGPTVLARLRAHGPHTARVLAMALAIAWTIATAAGICAARWHGRAAGWGLFWLLGALVAVPTACLATLAARDAPMAAREALGGLVLAAALAASPAQQLRGALIDAARSDWARTARALGAGPWRVIRVHALRHAALVPVALVGLEWPTALGGAFVVEKAFAVPGLGQATIDAIAARDVPWIMAMAIACVTAMALGPAASSAACGLIDPRLPRSPLGPARFRS